MQRRRQTVELSRRDALALAGGLGPGLHAVPRIAAAAGDTAPILSRPIPSSGERLPVVGLGTAYQWYADVPEAHTALTEVVRALTTGGGSVIDTGSTYGAAETILGEILTETGLR